jgi:hypothetical protein
VTFRFTSPDPAARFSCTWDGRVIAPCASPMVVTDLSFGRHELLVFATDAADNVDRTPAHRAFDVRPPPAPVRGRIVARWRVAKHATRVERLLVTGLHGAGRVIVRGRGPGWRLLSPRLHPVEIPSLWPGPWPVVDARAALRRTKLRPGSRITIRVTEHWAIAKVATFRIRHRRPPAGGVFRCLPPGAGKPVACSP